MNRNGAARLLALGLILACLLGGCEDKPGGSAAPAATPRAAAAPAPASLVAELYIPEPRRSWLTVRDAVRGPTLMLPRSISGLVVNVLGLPLRAVGEVDETKAIVGAVVTLPGRPGDGGSIAAASALAMVEVALPTSRRSVAVGRATDIVRASLEAVTRAASEELVRVVATGELPESVS